MLQAYTYSAKLYVNSSSMFCANPQDGGAASVSAVHDQQSVAWPGTLTPRSRNLRQRRTTASAI